MSNGRRHRDPRYDRVDSDSLRIQLDRERAARDRRAVAFEQKFFEATTRDLLPPTTPDEVPKPSLGGATTLPPVTFTDAELERF
ncbi:hypothetical protein ACWDTP_19300 [Mycobacterium sp. NPDC003449]